MRRFVISMLAFAIPFAAVLIMLAAWTSAARENGHGAPLAMIVMPLLVPTVIPVVLIPSLGEAFGRWGLGGFVFMAILNGLLVGAMAALIDRWAYPPRLGFVRATRLPRMMFRMAAFAVILVAIVEGAAVLLLMNG